MNECRWSSSREATFSECKKRYWYSYYGAWEGWPKTPYDSRTSIDPVAEYLYMLKNMQSVHMFVGTVVHKAIEEALVAAQPNRTLFSLEKIQERAADAFSRGLSDSRERLWLKSPKRHVNLVEHYYSLPFDKAEEQKLITKIFLCLANWHQSPCVQKGILDSRAEWLGVETSQIFEISPHVEAIVVFDLLMQWKGANGNSVTYVFDWKTGQESKRIEDQLSAYAIAVHTIFHVPLHAIVLSPFYLSAGPMAYKKYGIGQKDGLTEKQLALIKEKIEISARAMLALHPPKKPDGTIPLPDPTLFAYAEDRRCCRNCSFQELCQAAQFEAKSIEELAHLVPQR